MRFLQVNENTDGSSGREAWNISISKTRGESQFTAAGSTTASLTDEARASSSAGSVWVDTYSDHESAGGDTLMYGTDRLDEARIRFEQVAFADFQPETLRSFWART